MVLSSHSAPGHTGRWQRYLDLISSSLAAAGPEGEPGDDGCGSYSSVIDEDLRVWRERGGVKWEEFQSVKDSPHMRAVHYQVVDHQLYRQEECMFGPR